MESHEGNLGDAHVFGRGEGLGTMLGRGPRAWRRRERYGGPERRLEVAHRGDAEGAGIEPR